MTDVGLDSLLTVAEALRILDAVSVAPRVVRVEARAAVGCVLAADVTSDRAYPPADKSLMDGYAVRSMDTRGHTGGGALRVVGEVAAGVKSTAALGPGEAVAIMTGGFLPDGADAVVPVELVEIDGAALRVPPTPAGRSVARRGSDGRAGMTVLRAGQTVSPRQLAAAATVGARELPVYAPPRVGVLVTGDEIGTADPLGTRDSNGPLLTTLLRAWNCDVTDLGHAPDDFDALRAALDSAKGLDVLFIAGGMSMGKYDFVPRLLTEAGYDLKIRKLKIRPGKPFVFGERTVTSDERRAMSAEDDVVAHHSSLIMRHSPLAARRSSLSLPRFVFGLPGNPVSGYVCTVRLGAGLLRRMGAGGAGEKWLTLPLAAAAPANGPREAYLPATISADGVTILPSNGSADVFTLAAADVLVTRPADAPARPAGEMVQCLEIL